MAMPLLKTPGASCEATVSRRELSRVGKDETRVASLVIELTAGPTELVERVGLTSVFVTLADDGVTDFETEVTGGVCPRESVTSKTPASTQIATPVTVHRPRHADFIFPEFNHQQGEWRWNNEGGRDLDRPFPGWENDASPRCNLVTGAVN